MSAALEQTGQCVEQGIKEGDRRHISAVVRNFET